MLLKDKKEQMNEAVKELDFETAAIIRDEIRKIESVYEKTKPKKKKPKPRLKGATVRQDFEVEPEDEE